MKISGAELDTIYEYCCSFGGTFTIKTKKLKAILQRLQLAEDAVQQAYRCNPDNRHYYRWLQEAR